MATGPSYNKSLWSTKLIFIKLILLHTTEAIAAANSSGTPTMSSTVITTNVQCSCSNCFAIIIPVTTIVSTLVAISVIIIVVLILIWYRKRRTAPIDLTKHRKESDENSYTSSKHSHESGSKSPDPEYDVIKINPSTDKLEAHFVKSKSDISCQVFSSVQSNILTHEEDWDCGHRPMYSSADTKVGSPHKIGDFNVQSAVYTDIKSHIEVNTDDITDNIIPSNGNSSTHQSIDTATITEDNSVKPHTYAEIDVKQKKANKEYENEISKEVAVKGDEDGDEGSTPPPVPPQTTEMLYVAIQNENDKEEANN